MEPTFQDYNQFAGAIADEFRERAIGLSPDSSRIVNRNPADYILTGFLTPVQDEGGVPPIAAGGTTGEPTADLPSDSSYEQTNMGLEYHFPLSSTGVQIFEVTMSVYVRRYPTRDEQLRAMSGMKRSKGGPSSPLVAVWTREDPGTFCVEIDLAELVAKGQLQFDLNPVLVQRLGNVDRASLYPGKKELGIEPDALTDEKAFALRLSRLPAGTLESRWRPILDVRLLALPSRPELARFSARVINRTPATPPDEYSYFDPNLYCVSLRGHVPKGQCVPMIFRELPRSYRYDRSLSAQGVNCHVDVHDMGDNWLLATTAVPKVDTPRLDPRTVPDAEPLFSELMRDPDPILERILQDMLRFDSDAWAKKVDSSSLEPEERAEAVTDRQRFQADEIDRFRRGIALLKDTRYPFVRRSFELMNETMYEMGLASGRHRSWRLFQIVFIVCQLPGLASREYPELRQVGDDRVEILWFAAGGGKTEAFLGLILWQAFFDRLRGKRIGVTAFVRYPLRLLTFQQMQRLSRALGVAELLRSKYLLGGARFSLGYYVGRGSTPNTISDREHTDLKRGAVPEKYRRIFSCPFCMGKDVRLEYDPDIRLIQHRCQNTSCPGGSERLPTYIVDDDVHRYLPTVVVSTVDKLAQVGQNQRFANLLGRFNMVCPIHGASFLDANKRLCQGAKEFENGGQPSVCEGRKVLCGPFHDPGPSLLVQDELHLLAEELGTFDAHYETAAMEMSSSFGYTPWKIIAATATIERFEDHAFNLYLKNAVQFPAPGPDAFKTFYFKPSERSLGRIFVGLVGIGRKHTPAVTRALTLLYLTLQEARTLAASDPAAAAKRYKTGPLSQIGFRNLIFNYELPLTYVLTRKGSDQVAEAIETRVKQDLMLDAPDHGDLLVEMFNGGVDMAEMIDVMEQIRSADPAEDAQRRVRGLVATNIIGHGVDVDRFNIIVFAGFTRLVAEYIQASARVGRTFPGISVFVATPQSERDRSILERFGKFHEYLDRLVDPSAINRWPAEAIDRTAPGILAGYLMGVAAADMGRRVFTVRHVQTYGGMRYAKSLRLDQILNWMTSAFGVSKAPDPEGYGAHLRTVVANLYNLILNTQEVFGGGKESNLNIKLAAMRSLRDTDDPAYIQVEASRDSKAEQVIRGFLR